MKEKYETVTMSDFVKWTEQISAARPNSPRYITWLSDELYDVFIKGYILGQQEQKIRRDS